MEINDKINININCNKCYHKYPPTHKVWCHYASNPRDNICYRFHPNPGADEQYQKVINDQIKSLGSRAELDIADEYFEWVGYAEYLINHNQEIPQAVREKIKYYERKIKKDKRFAEEIKKQKRSVKEKIIDFFEEDL